jgi:predicted PurR-regulated permease PerM
VSRPGGVPIRTIAATIGMVLATFLLLLLVMQVRRVLIWAVIALFFAVALYPAVNWVEQHVPPRRRTVATLLVFLGALLIIAGLVELAGVLGALLAIPVVGVLQVVFRDLWDARRRRLEQKPAVGDEEAPRTAMARGPTAESRVEHGQPPTSPEPAAANRGRPSAWSG